MNKSIKINIPADEDGYVLLKCQYCGNLFKMMPEDIDDERLLYRYCPSCGLVSSSYLTNDVNDLVDTKVTNYVNDIIDDFINRIERTSNKNITIKGTKKPKKEYEKPIRPIIDNLEIARFDCCNRSAKIKPLLKFTGCYCPFCGVKNDGIE